MYPPPDPLPTAGHSLMLLGAAPLLAELARRARAATCSPSQRRT